MDRDRAHDEVVSDLTALQGRLRGVDPLEASEAFDTVTVTEGDVSVRMSAIGDRLSRLEQDLARVDARIDQEVPERYTVVEWRHFPSSTSPHRSSNSRWTIRSRCCRAPSPSVWSAKADRFGVLIQKA